MRSLRVAAAASVVAAALLITGCTSDPLAEDYLSGGNQNYISGSGIDEIPQGQRGEPIVFEGETDAGTTVSSADYVGEVTVVNFWYAQCPPCRAEARDLAELADEYDGAGASFIGVNTRDGIEQARTFANEFDIGYPSFLDQRTGEVRLAFAGSMPPAAVPTTFVLDREGRIAARILGELQAKSILDTLISDTIAES